MKINLHDSVKTLTGTTRGRMY